MYEWGLIDLKRLHDDVEYWEQHDDPKQPDYDTRDIEDVINHQPIVDAIPIEWLKSNYGGLQIVRYIMKDWELHDSVVVPYKERK